MLPVWYFCSRVFSSTPRSAPRLLHLIHCPIPFEAKWRFATLALQLAFPYDRSFYASLQIYNIVVYFQAKYALGVLVTILIGVASEAIVCFRRKLQTKVCRTHLRSSRITALGFRRNKLEVAPFATMPSDQLSVLPSLWHQRISTRGLQPFLDCEDQKTISGKSFSCPLSTLLMLPLGTSRHSRRYEWSSLFLIRFVPSSCVSITCFFSDWMLSCLFPPPFFLFSLIQIFVDADRDDVSPHSLSCHSPRVGHWSRVMNS